MADLELLLRKRLLVVEREMERERYGKLYDHSYWLGQRDVIIQLLGEINEG